jgi:DNA uptake protein ComE-like DNA-binding protein
LITNSKKISSDKTKPNAQENIRGGVKPAQGLALLAVVFALGYLLVSHFSNHKTVPCDRSSYPGQGDCGYQLVIGDRPLGTVFFSEPSNLKKILDRLEKKGLKLTAPNLVFPCGSVIHLKDGNIQEVKRLPGEQVITCGKRIDLNEATEEDLMSIPGIGPGTAKRICERRGLFGPFESVSDLGKIRGIGPKKVLDYRKYLK